MYYRHYHNEGRLLFVPAGLVVRPAHAALKPALLRSKKHALEGWEGRG